MSNYSNNYEVFGATALTGAAIVVSAVIWIAFLAGTSPQMGTVTQAANVPVEQVAAVAPRHAEKSS